MIPLSQQRFIKIHILHCGQAEVDIAVPFRQKTLNPIAYTGFFRSKKHRVTLPVSAYLIEHPKGLLLVDTGWHPDVRTNQVKALNWLHSKINKAILPDGQAIDEQLKERGIQPADLDYVIMSHLDVDHAGGLKLVRDARRILVDEKELRAANKFSLRYLPKMWEGVELEAITMQPSPYGPFQKSYDLFGDESVVLVSLPGHSAGMAGVLIQNRGKFVMLNIDCGYASKSWEQMIPCGVIVNKRKFTASLRWVHDMAQKPQCIAALASHDPDVKPHVIEI